MFSLKRNLDLKKYIEIVDKHYHRIALSRLRLSAHLLEIETGRYNNITKKEQSM